MREEAVGAVICVALALAGCSRRPLTPYDFAFVTTNTTYQQVLKRLGAPDRGYGSARDNARGNSFIITYEWDLTSSSPGDHYVMLMKIEGPIGQYTNRIQSMVLTNRPAFIDYSTNRRAQQP